MTFSHPLRDGPELHFQEIVITITPQRHGKYLIVFNSGEQRILYQGKPLAATSAPN